MSVLEPALAQKFVDKTAKHIEYNINIMNDKGIIIASKDASRVGNFHEVAYGMLNGTLETGVVKEDQKFIGTKPGVNLFIDYKNKHVGVICVTGNPDNVHSFARLVKISMETMLEYELQIKMEYSRRGRAENFIYYLLLEENMDSTVAISMADELELKKDLLRICIIIKYDDEINYKKIVDMLTKTNGHTHQDIIAKARNDDIILLKALSVKYTEAVKYYRDIIGEYLTYFMNKIQVMNAKDNFSFYVGSLQTQIEKCRSSYIHAQELMIKAKEKKGIQFFNDHLLDYFRSIVNIKTYDNIFSAYDSLFTDEEKKQIAETVVALSKNNYNVVYTSKAMYIHRNTLLFRLNKLKDVLNIDPIANSSDREFLNELAYYFNNNK
jgi:carbohydrate diacid regulator